MNLRAYFDSVRHDLLLAKVAKGIQDADVLHLLKLILKASGKARVLEGGVISPVLSDLYFNEVDRMLEKAKAVTRTGQWTHIESARYADDLVILIDGHPRHAWLLKAVNRHCHGARVRVGAFRIPAKPPRQPGDNSVSIWLTASLLAPAQPVSCAQP